MLANTILAVTGNVCSFAVDHRVDGAVYELQEYEPGKNEQYRVTIRKQLKDDARLVVDSADATFEFDCNLAPGDYYFEISVIRPGTNGIDERVISPATDERGVRLNCLHVVSDI